MASRTATVALWRSSTTSPTASGSRSRWPGRSGGRSCSGSSSRGSSRPGCRARGWSARWAEAACARLRSRPVSGPPRRRVVTRRSAIAKLDVPEGRELRDRDGLPVRVDEPRVRARDRALDLHRLAVHARRVRRRDLPDRADVARAAALRHQEARGGGAYARRRRGRRAPAHLGGISRQLPSAASSSRRRPGRTSRTISAATGRCSGRRSARDS